MAGECRRGTEIDRLIIALVGQYAERRSVTLAIAISHRLGDAENSPAGCHPEDVFGDVVR
jgi:hypothetical protein